MRGFSDVRCKKMSKMSTSSPPLLQTENMLTFRELKADMAIIQYERTDLKQKLSLLSSQHQKQSEYVSKLEQELEAQKEINLKLEESFKEYRVRSEDERDGLATCLRQQALTRQLNTSDYKEFEIESFSKKISTLEVKLKPIFCCFSSSQNSD